jgi:formylglycine-generating enzyme required for sulfatase activity
MTRYVELIRLVVSARLIAVVLTIAFLFLTCAFSPALAVKKYAVLVGCNEYDGVIAPPLTGCITDVKNISDALKKQGYKVWMMTDDAIDPETKKPNPARYYPHKQNIERQLPIWIPAGGFDKGDTVIFFFSGHGVRMTDGNDYLVPLGFQSVEPSDLVGLSKVYEILRKSGAENIVVITDACRNIPGKAIGGMDESKGFGEKSLEKAKSLGSGDQRYAFLRSCAEDQKSYERSDGGGGNYVFYLVKGLEGNADGVGDRGKKDGTITIGELNAYAKDNVMTEAQKKNQVQIPQYERKGDDPDSITISVDSNFVSKPVPSEDAKIEQVSTLATIKITSDPVGASVWIDDVQIEGQATPCEVEIDLGAVKSRKVEVALRQAGCKDAVYNITALRGKSVALNGKLASKPAIISSVATPIKTETPETTLTATVSGNKIGDTSINPKDGAEMVWVPEGEFLMGSEVYRETPQRKVYLDGYWMYKYEVTVAQYEKFCSETGKLMATAPKWGWIDSHPIVNVSWNDAVDYAKWAGGSLPTEAQWEKAARGMDGREYPWGNQWDGSKCNNSGNGTQPVGSYAAGVSPYGCMDMAGNVMEWCSDWYGDHYYKSAPSRNPSGPADGSYRVLRGGCWTYGDRYDHSRCACRYSFNEPSNTDIYDGFRLVR